jgi:1-acyl-sn-glycerol-3-phosphate acyltransferase
MAEENIPPQKKENFMKSLKIDENLEKVREKLDEFGMLEPLDDFLFWSAYPGLNLALKTLFNFKVRGKENFPKSGPYMLIMNYQSDLDPFLLNFAAPRKVRWFVREKSVNIPIVKTWVQAIGFIVMKPTMSDKDGGPMIVKMLEEGQVVGMFPESEASEDGKLGDFHRAPARFCLQLKVPYIPVAIMGSNEAFPKGTKPWEAKIGKKIEVRFGRPVTVDPKLEQTPEDAAKVAKQMKKEIKALMKREYP